MFLARNSTRKKIGTSQSEEGGDGSCLRLAPANSCRRRLAEAEKLNHRTCLTDQERAKMMVAWTLPARGAAGEPSAERRRGWCRPRLAGPAWQAAAGRYKCWAAHRKNFTDGATLTPHKCSCWRCMENPDDCWKVASGLIWGHGVPAQTENNNPCHSMKNQVAQSFLSGRVGETANNGCSAPEPRRAFGSLNSSAAQFSQRDFWGIQVPLKKIIIEIRRKNKNCGRRERDEE